MFAEIAKPPVPSPLPSALRERDARPVAGMRGEPPPHLGDDLRLRVLALARAAAPDRGSGCASASCRLPETPIDGSICATPSMPLSSFSSLKRDLVVPSSDVPSGVSRWIVHSPMSSFGTNSRPTIRFSGKRRTAPSTTEIAMMPSDGRAPSSPAACTSRRASGRSRAPSSCDPPRASDSFRNRELSIGVSVKLTSIDTRIENAIVQPNGLMKRLA